MRLIRRTTTFARAGASQAQKDQETAHEDPILLPKQPGLQRIFPHGHHNYSAFAFGNDLRTKSLVNQAFSLLGQTVAEDAVFVPSKMKDCLQKLYAFA
jgi:hypothetical protein